MGNVYVFPGIPHLLRKGFENVAEDIFKGLSSRRFFTKKLYVNCRETEIAATLNSLVSEHRGVTFGSYPDLFNAYYKTKITLETTSEELAEQIVREARHVHINLMAYVVAE